MGRTNDIMRANAISQRNMKIGSLERKWESEELNRKLEEGDFETGVRWELDYQYKRELRAGLHD